MLMRREFISKATAACGCMLLIPKPMTATSIFLQDDWSCSSGEKEFALKKDPGDEPEADNWRATIAPWKLGDCYMNNAQIIIRRAGYPSFFEADMHTDGGGRDYWHLFLTITGKQSYGSDAPGTFTTANILDDVHFKSPPMSQNDQPAVHHWHEEWQVDHSYPYVGFDVKMRCCC